MWVGNPDTTCFESSQAHPWYCYSVLPRMCLPPVTNPPPTPDYSECETGFGLPYSGPVGPIENFEEASWGWSFFYVPTETALLEIVVGAGNNELDNGHIFGTMQFSISEGDVVSVSFDFTDAQWVVSEFHIDIESEPKYRRGAVGKYAINIDYLHIQEYYNEEGPLPGKAQGSFSESFEGVSKTTVEEEGPLGYWVTVHVAACPYTSTTPPI